MNIALCGIKHSGKSTLGKLLAARLNVPFSDADAELIRREGHTGTIRELYRKLGAEEFRRREAALLCGFSGDPLPRVLALGGGALENPFFPEDKIRALGVLVWIDVPDAAAYERILRGGLPPFLSQAADPFAEFCRMNGVRRETFARLADLKFRPAGNDKSINAEALFAAIREWKEKRP